MRLQITEDDLTSRLTKELFEAIAFVTRRSLPVTPQVVELLLTEIEELNADLISARDMNAEIDREAKVGTSVEQDRAEKLVESQVAYIDELNEMITQYSEEIGELEDKLLSVESVIAEQNDIIAGLELQVEELTDSFVVSENTVCEDCENGECPEECEDEEYEEGEEYEEEYEEQVTRPSMLVYIEAITVNMA